MRTAVAQRVVSGRVNADGTIAAGFDFRVQKTGVGAFTVTISVPGFRLQGVTASWTTSSWGLITPFTFTANSFAVVLANPGASVATDSAWSFVAVGATQ